MSGFVLHESNPRAWWWQRGRLYVVVVKRSRYRGVPVIHRPDRTSHGEPRVRWRIGRYAGSLVWDR